jgi:hypothetical protein
MDVFHTFLPQRIHPYLDKKCLSFLINFAIAREKAQCSSPTEPHFTHYLFTQGRRGEGRDEPERRLEGQQFTQLVENTNMDDCIASL